MQEKIKNIDALRALISEERQLGRKIVHCHGVFDLLHPGHIRHLQEAKAKGDTLIVSVTPDRFVNKGPGRPFFSEQLRVEQLAALSCVDHVVLNNTADAMSLIHTLTPDIYVKGVEYQDHTKDVTGKIVDESMAVEAHGGKIHYTDDLVFSSSHLINQLLDNDAQRIAPFIGELKLRYSADEIIKKIETLQNLRVLVVGDAIIDEYQYINPLGQSGKGVHLAAELLDREVFLGGSLIIANHLASFAKEVTLMTGVGKTCSHLPFINSHLNARIIPRFTFVDQEATLTKRRYVIKDGKTVTKLFETYSSNKSLLNNQQCHDICAFLQGSAHTYDLLLVCDFGNGFTSAQMIDALSALPVFLAVNTQTNSGNRGFNVVTNYHRADYISLNEPELRLAAHDRTSRLETVAHDISEILDCSHLSVTRGVEGVYLYSKESEFFIPALTQHVLDRVGAGDSYFALSSLCLAQKFHPLLAGFIGSVAAAIGVQKIGNKEATNRVELCKYIARLMK